MGDSDEPQPLLTEVVPTPTSKSTLPCDIGDPLLSLTPQKPTGLSHCLKQRSVRVERHVPTGALIDARTNKVSSRRNRTTELKSNVQSNMSSKNKSCTKTSANRKYAKENAPKTELTGTAEETIEASCTLQQPQCHTTAVVGRHLDWLQREQFNENSAVIKALRQSEEVKVTFAEKVAEGVNRPVEERKYSGNISGRLYRGHVSNSLGYQLI